MGKRLTFSVAFAVCLIITIAAAIFVQAQPAQTCETPPQNLPPGSIVNYLDGANVGLQLPPAANQSHPVNLRIIVSHIYAESDYGGPDVMQVQIWASALNQYVGAAILSTNPNETAIAWIKSVVNGTPIWTPPTMMNYFVPTPDELQVFLDEDVLIANLSTSFNVTLPAALGGNFTIPPMSLMFRPIAPGFAHEDTTVLPKPRYSGWTIEASHVDVPAWVRTFIPAWVANAPVETVGTLMMNGTTIYIPPAT